jgi:hypothetical protein
MARRVILALFLAAGLAVAAPQIKFESVTFDGGPKMQDKDTLVNAVFKYTNTGTAPLVVSGVRVSCGCTVVSYDTIVQPGKTGILKPVVNVKGFRTGPMSRTVTLMSNAANTPSQMLTITATITSPVEVSTLHLKFGSAAKETVYLSSVKKDLKVSGVVFRPQQRGGNAPSWTAGMPLNISYKFTPTDSTSADGMRVFKLELDNPVNGKEPISGDIKITTNHPDQREITLTVDNH